MPDARDPRAAFMLEGVGADEVIGDFGLAGGGAAGYEIDRYDLALGTPPNSLLLASSLEHSVNYPHVCEEIYFNYPGLDGTNDFMVRADLVFLRGTSGAPVQRWTPYQYGQVFQSPISGTLGIRRRF